MARNKTLFLYNQTKVDQEWSVYSQDVINQNFTIGQTRKSFTLSLSGAATIQFGVDDAVYLTATYTYATDSWTSNTNTPNEISFSVLGAGVNVRSSFTP